MKGKRITPERGKIYKNKGGGEFLCIRGYDGDAIMQNIASRWTFVAHGIIQYDDDSIEWDYSTGGHFERLEKECRLCTAKFDFGKLFINQYAGEWSLGFRGGSTRNYNIEDMVCFCPECGRELTDDDFGEKEVIA